MNKIVVRPAALQRIEEACRTIAECHQVDTVKKIRDQAAAMRAFLRQQKASREIQNDAAEIKLRAERRIGELLIEQKASGTRDAGGRGRVGLRRATQPPATLADLGIEKTAAKRWQDEARVPKARFEEYVRDARASGEVTTSGLLAVIKGARRTSRRQERHESMSTQPLASGQRYSVLLADPPWRYEHCEESRAIENQYPTMSLDAICALPIGDVAARDCVLFMWATSPKLAESMRVLESWGFDYRTCAVWVKDKIGMGYYFRQRHELLLVAVQGSPPVPGERARFDSVISAPRKRHSQKPDLVYEMIEKMYPTATRLELFARKCRDRWSSWGNETTEAIK